MRRGRDDRGTANALIVVLMSGVMLVAAGVAFDGSRVLAARREAVDVATQAARAGAQAVAVERVRAGQVVVDPAAAVAAANAFLRSSGHDGSASFDGEAVVVSVGIDVRLPLLSAAGLSSTTASGQGSARIVRGISEADR